VGKLDELFREKAGVGIVVEIRGVYQLSSLYYRSLVLDSLYYAAWRCGGYGD
jgi:hypothetical protein